MHIDNKQRFKPGDKIIIDRLPVSFNWYNINNSNQCPTIKGYSHYNQLKFPIEIKVKYINIVNNQNRFIDHIQIVDTKGYGWVQFDYFKLAKKKLTININK